MTRDGEGAPLPHQTEPPPREDFLDSAAETDEAGPGLGPPSKRGQRPKKAPHLPAPSKHKCGGSCSSPHPQSPWAQVSPPYLDSLPHLFPRNYVAD